MGAFHRPIGNLEERGTSVDPDDSDRLQESQILARA